jgi:hypothetical protein
VIDKRYFRCAVRILGAPGVLPKTPRHVIEYSSVLAPFAAPVDIDPGPRVGNTFMLPA